MSTVLFIVYVLAFLSELAGVVLVVREIRDDRRKFVRLLKQLTDSHSVTQFTDPVGGWGIGGSLGAAQGQEAARNRLVEEFLVLQTASGLGGRRTAIALIATGISLGLAGNLLSI